MSIKDLFERLIGREGELESSPVLERMALLGDADAQYKLGAICYQGDGTEQNFKGAFKWFSAAAGQEQLDAQYALGEMYYHGHGIKQDYKEALQWYQKAAGRGQADAQYAMGRAFYYGRGILQDYQQALQWYQKASEQGQVDAQCALGEMYSSGNGVGEDRAYAMCWFEQAAEQGHAGAQYQLANIYKNGNGAKKNSQVAVMWCEQAAVQGNMQAQCDLADLYSHGEGTAQDYGQAMKWYRQAAEQGSVYAQRALGAMYYQGKGTVQNYGEAFKWYQAAAEQAEAEAQRILGDMYYYGHGVEHNYEEAFQWYNKAAEQGDAEAAEHISRLKTYLEKKADVSAADESLPVSAPADIVITKSQPPIKAPDREALLKSLLAEFNGLIGLEEVKHELNTLFSLIRVNQMRKGRGLPSQETYKDCIFTGHMGTGKSTVAGWMARIYSQLGVIDKDSVREIRAGKLVEKDAEAIRKEIQEQVMQSLGGLLYIDEPYILGKLADIEREKQFCDTLMGLMAKYKEELVVILAGDKNEMQLFLAAHPQLGAKFHNQVHFNDYSASELQQILVSMILQTGYLTTPDAEQCIREILEQQVARHEFQLQNARGLGTLLEQALANQAVRLIENMDNISDEQLVTLTREDFTAEPR